MSLPARSPETPRSSGSIKHTQTPRQKANAELADRAIRHAQGHAAHRPVQVYLQLASACNLSCYMCSEYNRPAEARHGVGLISLSPEIFGRLEREVFPWSTQLFLGVGGEPTFSEHFVDYVTRAGAANQEVSLITNGTYLGREPVARAIAENVSKIQVSIDAATLETYERIRIGSRWSRLVGGIEQLQRFRRESSLDSRFTLNYVLMRSNVRELPAFVDLASELGADAVHAQHVIAMTEPSQGEPLLLEPGLYDEMRAEAILRAERNGIEIDLPAAFDGTDRERCSVLPDPSLEGYAVPCRDPNQTLIVLYDGRVFACCHPLAHEKMQLGNMTTQSFEEIWNHSHYQRLRQGLRSGDVPEICRKCSVVHSPPPVIEDAREYAEAPDIKAYFEEADAGSHAQDGVLGYVEDLRTHADVLDEYVTNLREHADTLDEERRHLLGHVSNLDRERGIRDEERDRMLSHIDNLENLGPMALLRRLRRSTWRRLSGGR